MNCDGRCSGCALKIGAKAHTEPDNRLTATLCALGGVPFYCHEKMGWLPGLEDYPTGQARIVNTVNNLMTAPALVHNSPELCKVVSDATASGLPLSIFDGDRAFLGRHPHCQGWRAAVGRLARQGWFRDSDARKARRAYAQCGITALDMLKRSKDPAGRMTAIRTAGEALKMLVREARRIGINVGEAVESD